jgi:hypothetical protein
MTYQNARALLAALGVYFLSQIVIAGAPVIDSPANNFLATFATGISLVVIFRPLLRR